MRMASRFIALYPGILLHCCLILPQAQSSDLATAGSSAVSAGLEQQNLTSSADQGRIRAIQLNHLKAADAAEQLNKLLNQPDLEPLDGKNTSRINIWPGFTDKVLRVEADADDLATVMALLKFVDTPSDIPQKPSENAARRVASGQEGAAPDAMNDRLHSIRLQHIEAADAAEQLNKLLNPSALQGNPGGKRTQRIRIRPGSAANLLSVEADPEDLVTVMELVKFLDTPPERAADSPRAGSPAKGSRAGKIAKLADNAAGSVGFYEQQSQEKPQLPEQLTLQDAIGLALKNSVQLELAVMDLLAAREETQGAEGYMEPDLVMDASIEESRRKNTVEQSIRLLSDTFEEDNTRYSMAVEGILPLGTSYRVGYDMDDLANSLTNRSYALPFRSEYTGFAGVSVTQPLLKNFGSTYTRSNLINARLEEEIARQNLRKQWMRTVANTVLAYWDVWMHQKLAGVRFNSLKNARNLQSDNEKRRAEGKMAEIEVDTARAGVVDRETRWLDAVNRYHEALNSLADLLSVNLGEKTTVLENPELVMVEDEDLDVKTNLKSMWGRHPDLKIRSKEVEIGELRLKVFSNQSKPELNLVGNYGHNGLGADLGESNEDITDGDFDRWSVGLVFRMGLAGGQEMFHRTRKAEIELQRSRLTLDYVEKELENRMRTILRQVKLLRNTVRQQSEGVKIAKKVLAAEQKLLDAGKSKTARVLEVEEKLLKAMEDYLNVQLYYQQGLIEMRIANAQILEEFALE